MTKLNQENDKQRANFGWLSFYDDIYMKSNYMSPREKELHEEVSKIVQKAFEGTPALNEAGLTGWVIDKISNGLKWAVNKHADYQYDALLNSKEFRGLANRYGYKSEADFVKRAKELIRQDPKKFAKILAYDVRDSIARKYNLY